MFASFTRRDWLQVAAFLAVIAAMHVVGFGVLIAVVAPQHLAAGTQIFGIGLGLTAYMFGVRHAFDADHIAAIDNTTRKLVQEGSSPKSVGFWFSIGHSTIVFAMAAVVAFGAHWARTLVESGSTANTVLSIIGPTVSGLFLVGMGMVNILALRGIWGFFSKTRRGEEIDESALEHTLHSRGFFARLLAPMIRAVRKPWQMYPVGVLFGLGFDTATEVALLVLAGSGAAAGLPWYAIMVLPLLFAAGMSLMDFLDGLLMNGAYDWAFITPARKVFYNFTITALSVVIALLIGIVELVAVLHDNAGWHNPVTNWIAGLSLDNVGYAIVALMLIAWLVAVAYWKSLRLERPLTSQT